MTVPLTPEHFASHVEKTFQVKGSHHTLTLSRIDRRQLEAWEAATVPREPFNLIFRGPAGEVLPAGLYVLDVEDGPSFELYVMPIHTPMSDRQNYQAAFN